MSEDTRPYEQIAKLYGNEKARLWRKFAICVSEQYDNPPLALNIINSFPDLSNILTSANFERAELDIITRAGTEETLTKLLKKLQKGYELFKHKEMLEAAEGERVQFYFLRKQPDGEWNGSEDNTIRILEDC